MLCDTHAPKYQGISRGKLQNVLPSKDLLESLLQNREKLSFLETLVLLRKLGVDLAEAELKVLLFDVFDHGRKMGSNTLLDRTEVRAIWDILQMGHKYTRQPGPCLKLNEKLEQAPEKSFLCIDKSHILLSHVRNSATG